MPRKRPPDTRPGDRHRRPPRAIRLPENVDAALVEQAKEAKTTPHALIVEAVRRLLGIPADGVDADR